MSSQRRVITVRPKYRSTVSDSVRGNSSLTTPPASRMHANTHTRAHAAEHTTTTNVVSVVCEAVRKRTHASTHASEVGDFVERLKKMSTKDRKAVLDSLLLEQQLSDGPKANRDLDMWAEAVHREFTQRLGSADGGLVGPALVRKAVAVGTSWAPVQAFMETSKLQELPVVERQRAYYMLAELVVRHALGVARHTGIPLSVKLVSQCTGNLPGLFDNAYPGYLEAGLAKMVARHTEHA